MRSASMDFRCPKFWTTYSAGVKSSFEFVLCYVANCTEFQRVMFAYIQICVLVQLGLESLTLSSWLKGILPIVCGCHFLRISAKDGAA